MTGKKSRIDVYRKLSKPQLQTSMCLSAVLKEDILVSDQLRDVLLVLFIEQVRAINLIAN